MIKKCVICGKEFNTFPSRVKNNRGKYCSSVCYRVKTPKISKTCPTCGKIFEVKKSHSNRKHCSKVCYSKWSSENNRGENANSWKGGKVSKICIYCGGEFKMPKSTPTNKGKYCSKICCDKHKIEKIGDKAGNWRGGLTPVNSLIRHSINYKKWICDVFTRDNFTCQKCGGIGGVLNAHHKKRFCILLGEARHYFDLFNIYDAAMAYSPLWDISNGITLCESCHKKEHRRNNEHN